MWQVKNLTRWTHKFAMRRSAPGRRLANFLLVPLAPTAGAQVSVGIGVGVNPPMCAYGYYNYAPYGCAPSGFYGPGYFYNGVFLGVGPWAHWGYGPRLGWHTSASTVRRRTLPWQRRARLLSQPWTRRASTHANHSGGHVM